MYTGLEIDSILKSFGERTILADVYLKCCRGDIIALFGRNGTGKSTLLNIIFGTLKADRKFIRIDGKVIKGPAFRSGLLAYLPQHPSFPSHLKVSRIAELCIAPEDRKRFSQTQYYFASGPPVSVKYQPENNVTWKSKPPFSVRPLISCWTNLSAASRPLLPNRYAN